MRLFVFGNTPLRSSLVTCFGIMALVLAGCATYRPRPLPVAPDLAPAPASTKARLRAPLTGELLGPHPINIANGLDLTEIAMLAVGNNPDLKAERARRRVARAELYSAGLLPDPQFSAGLDHPTGGGPGLINAYNLGLDYDVRALILRGAGLRVAKAAAREIDLDILWREWQVAQKARSLAVRMASQKEKEGLLARTLELYRKRYDLSAAGLARGDVTIDVTGADLTALLDAATQLNQLRESLSETRTALHSLLGLAPSAPVSLAPLPMPQPCDGRVVQKALADLAERRPDLLALQAGYASQEAKVRLAVLEQFPALSFGLTRARDTSNVPTSGFGVTLNLPLFTGNRGAIAVERATREKLHAEYQARLDAAVNDAARLLEQQKLIVSQRSLLKRRLPELKRMVTHARSAYSHGDLAAIAFLNMETTLINKELEAVDLDMSLWQEGIALQTLLAVPAIPGRQGGNGAGSKSGPHRRVEFDRTQLQKRR